MHVNVFPPNLKELFMEQVVVVKSFIKYK
jgi:hypothetical protein